MTTVPPPSSPPPPSPAADAGSRIVRFPFPFPRDAYRYGTNVEPARRFVPTEAGGWGERLLDLDGEYRPELALRREILERDPSRCAVLPHMRIAAWDTLWTVLRELAATYPEHMSLRRDGRSDGRYGGRGYRWRNGLLGIEHDFVFGDDDSVPGGPLRFAGEQVQEDLVLLDRREGWPWVDAGLVTFAAGWSFGFDLGMRFREVHGPVPRVLGEGVITRAERFLMGLRPGQEFRRTNWSMTVDRRLDVSTESAPEWESARRSVLGDERFAERLHLRVEVQHLVGLAASDAVLFLIRSYLVSLTELAEVPAWRTRLGRVLAELPGDMADYKGLTFLRAPAVRWLSGDR